MKLVRLSGESGYSLMELIVVIVILGIISSIAMSSLRSGTEIARVEETKRELDQLAKAIAGDQNLLSGGNRTDYGYVGDVGSMPSNLNALVQNPGGWITWDGPYILDAFYAVSGGAESEFKYDAWGKAYTYSGGNTIVSTGSGTNITRSISTSTTDLLSNRVAVTVTDFDNSPPGTDFADSVLFLISYPNGSGGMSTGSINPTPDGFGEFSSIPIGQHQLRVVYISTHDTLTRVVHVNPGKDVYVTVSLYSDLW